MGAALAHSARPDQTGSPQASIDIDANRLVLLDRLDNGDSDDTPDDDIAF